MSTNAGDYVWNANATDTSCLPPHGKKSSKKHPFALYQGLLFIVVFILIPVVILTVVFVIQTKRTSGSHIPTGLNASTTDQNPNSSQILIRGLLTMDTAAAANICEENQTIEDCVLLYNAKIIMNVLTLMSLDRTNPRSADFTFPTNTNNKTIDCKRLYIRRSQLPEVFEPTTLETLYRLSGVSYSPVSQQRSQVDARSIQNRWTAPINYYIDVASGLTAPMAANIRTAVSNWENNTCLRFNELSVITSSTNKSYVAFRRDDNYGCSSPVSYDPTDPTSVILISAYCSGIIGSIMHEIGHTLGFIHTQSRIDRDNYITLVSANILQDYAANFFKWYYGTIRFLDTNFPYDFGSFMHYEGYGFSSNGEATIVPIDTRFEKTIGQRERGSFLDFKQINRLYFNRADCPYMFTSNNCQNSGYLDPKSCSRCVCPDGFSGTFCEQRDSSSNCGDIITNPTPSVATQITIQNPSPTSTTSAQQYCVYHIRSQSAGKIRLRLDAIATLSRYVCSLSSMLEVKFQSDLGVTGARWCGATITSPWSNVTAESNTMVVIFRANNYINTTTRTMQTGFRATIFFDAESTTAGNQSTAPIVAPMTTTTTTTSTTTPLTTTTTSSACPPSSFRCQLATQPTCGGCLSYEPCTAPVTQPCTAYNYQVSLTGCDTIVNGVAQCRYQFTLVPYTTNCQQTMFFCCPNYQLVTYGAQNFCIYNPQAIDPSTWSRLG